MTNNVYEVTLDVKRHYGNGHFEYAPEAQKIIAKNGDEAVKKAKNRVKSSEPILQGLKILIQGVE